MGKLPLQMLFDHVWDKRKLTEWYTKKKEAITLSRDRQEHSYTLRYHYPINNRMVKEAIAEGYAQIFSKLKEFEKDLS